MILVRAPYNLAAGAVTAIVAASSPGNVTGEINGHPISPSCVSLLGVVISVAGLKKGKPGYMLRGGQTIALGVFAKPLRVPATRM